MPYEEYLKKWEDLVLSVKPVNREKAEASIIEVYKAMGMETPTFLWVDSPWDPQVATLKIHKTYTEKVRANYNTWTQKTRIVEDNTPILFRRAAEKARKYLQNHGLSADNLIPAEGRTWRFVGEMIHPIVWRANHSGFHFENFWWWSAFDYQYNRLPLTQRSHEFKEAFNIAMLIVKVAEEVPWWRPHKEVCLVSERPSRISFVKDDLERMVFSDHKQPAIEWGDKKFYIIDGVMVPDHFVTAPDKIIFADCLHENAEVRRVALNIFGRERFIKEGKGKIIDHDERYGTLWFIQFPAQATREFRNLLFLREPAGIHILEVTNRTPEPDGKFKHYFLKVPSPEAIAREFSLHHVERTAKAAVAWTFGMRSSEYDPEIES